MLKVVLDTNIIISGTIMDHGIPYQILNIWKKGDFTVIISEPILQEIDRVFHYSHIKSKRFLTEQDIETVLQTLIKYSINVPIELKIEAILDDPEYNKFIEAAVEGNADYIVSGDRHLKSLKVYQGIKIISPSEFIEILAI